MTQKCCSLFKKILIIIWLLLSRFNPLYSCMSSTEQLWIFFIFSFSDWITSSTNWIRLDITLSTFYYTVSFAYFITDSYPLWCPPRPCRSYLHSSLPCTPSTRRLWPELSAELNFSAQYFSSSLSWFTRKQLERLLVFYKSVVATPCVYSQWHWQCSARNRVLLF